MTARGLSMRQLVEGMALGFDPSAVDRPAVVELAFTGSERGTYQLAFSRSGPCRFRVGAAEPATLRVEADADAWRGVAEGRTDAMSAVLAGTVRADGDLGLFQRMPRIFPRLSPEGLRAPPGQRAPGPMRLPAMAWLALALLPWKLFWVATGFAGARPAVLAAAAAAVLVWAGREAAGGATLLERATAVAGSAAALALLLGASAPPGLVGTSFLALAAIWAATIVHARLPLTAEYARWNYAPRLWTTGLFRHPNAVLTLLWSGVFAALGVLGAAAVRGWLPRPAASAAGIALCLAAGWLTRRRETGARSRRVEDLDGALAVLGVGARAGLVLLAGALVLLGDPRAPSGWMLAPAAACVLAALLPGARSRGAVAAA